MLLTIAISTRESDAAEGPAEGRGSMNSHMPEMVSKLKKV